MKREDRLTLPVEGKNYYVFDPLVPENYTIVKAIEKLGHLEDIEDKFRMSLMDMFKILMEGAFVMCGHAPIKVLPSQLCMIYTKETGYCIITDWGETLLPEKYGKVWAFTSEEMSSIITQEEEKLWKSK